MFWQIRKRDDGALMETYQSNEMIIKGGELGDDARFVHLLVPEGYHPSVVDYNPGTEFTGPYLDISEEKLKSWKRESNLAAQKAFVVLKEKETDTQVAGLLQGNAETTALMEATNSLFKYLKALQAAAMIEDSALSTEGQEGKSECQGMQTALYETVQGFRGARDTEIAAFVAPHQDVSPLYP